MDAFMKNLETAFDLARDCRKDALFPFPDNPVASPSDKRRRRRDQEKRKTPHLFQPIPSDEQCSTDASLRAIASSLLPFSPLSLSNEDN
ncbi:hypothetical protein JTE90_010723 [Oedothorax gibbosus]|uniref:Uncharacterized protein n=1 Tax=Oedothorax gibbosus TaxID=931172 RepID=A0AAV6UNA4_9ARAC|nr:hypothetical protein JTE90_010723 [Oedothorax gibbosus]